MVERPLNFVVGSVQKTILFFPRVVRTEVSQALLEAQLGNKADNAKPLKGFHGARVLEIVSDADGNTCRVVYTTSDPDAIWVLHAFQKKSNHGIGTPHNEIELVRKRLNQIVK